MGTARIFNQDITIAGWEISANTDNNTLTLSKGEDAKKIEYQVTIPQSDKNEEEQQLLLEVLRRIENESTLAEEAFNASQSATPEDGNDATTDFPGLNALNFGVTRQIAFKINFGNDISYHSPQDLDTETQPPYLKDHNHRYYRTPTEKLLQIQIQDRSEDDYNTLINDWPPETTPPEIIDITHDSTLTQQFQDPDNPEQNIDGGKIASDFGIPYQRDLIINIFNNLDDKNKYIVSPENKQDLSVKQRWEDFQRGQYKYQIGDFHLDISESGLLTCIKAIKYMTQKNGTQTEILGENSYTVKIDEGRTPSLLAALESSNPNNFLNLYSSEEGQLDYQADLQSGNGLKVSLKAYQYADVKCYVSVVNSTVFIQTKDNSFKLTLPSNYDKYQLDKDIQNVVETKGNPLNSGCTVEVLQQSTIPSFNIRNEVNSINININININILELSKILEFPLINAEHAKEVFKNLAPPLREEIITNASLTLTTAVKEDAAPPNNSQAPVSSNNSIPKSALTGSLFSELRGKRVTQSKSKSTSTDKLSITSKKQRDSIEQRYRVSLGENLITRLQSSTSDVQPDPILSKYLDNTSQNLFNLSLLNHSSTFIPSKECLQVFEPLFRLLEDKSELDSSIIRKEFSKEDQLFIISLLVNSRGDGGGGEEEEKKKEAINSFCNSQFAEAEQIALSCVNDIILAVINYHKGNTSDYQGLSAKFKKLGIPEEHFNIIINLEKLQECSTKEEMQKLIEQNIKENFTKRRSDIATVLKNFFIERQRSIEESNYYHYLSTQKISNQPYFSVLENIVSDGDEYFEEFKGISLFLKALQKNKKETIAALKFEEHTDKIDENTLGYLNKIKNSPDQYALIVLTSDAMSYPKSRSLMYDILQNLPPAKRLLIGSSNIDNFLETYKITDEKEKEALKKILLTDASEINIPAFNILKEATAQIKDLFSDQLYESRISDLPQEQKVNAATVPSYRLLHLLVSPLEGSEEEINNIIYSQIREFFPYSTQNLDENPLKNDILKFIQKIKDDNKAITNSASESLKLYYALQEHTSIGSVTDPNHSSNLAHNKPVLEKIFLNLRRNHLKNSLSFTDCDEATEKLLLEIKNSLAAKDTSSATPEESYQKKHARTKKEFNVADILSQIKHLLNPKSGSEEEKQKFVKNLLTRLLPLITKQSLAKQKISINDVVSQLTGIFDSCGISNDTLKDFISSTADELEIKQLSAYEVALKEIEGDYTIAKLRAAIDSDDFRKFLSKISKIEKTTDSEFPIQELKSMSQLNTLFNMLRDNDSEQRIIAECTRLSESLSIPELKKVFSRVQSANKSIQDLTKTLKNLSEDSILLPVIKLLKNNKTHEINHLEPTKLYKFVELVVSIDSSNKCITEFLNIAYISRILSKDLWDDKSLKSTTKPFINALQCNPKENLSILNELHKFIKELEPSAETNEINSLCSNLSQGINEDSLKELAEKYSTTVKNRDDILSSLSFMEKTKALYDVHCKGNQDISVENVVGYFTYSTTLDKQYINNLNAEHTENAEEFKQTLSALHPDIDFTKLNDSDLSADNVCALLFKHHVASQSIEFSRRAWEYKPLKSHIAYCSRIDEICKKENIQLNNPASWAPHPELTFLVERLMHDSYPNTGFYAQPSRPESIKVSAEQKNAMLQTLESNIKTASTIRKNLKSFQGAIANLSEQLLKPREDENKEPSSPNNSLAELLHYTKGDISYRHPAPFKDMSLNNYPCELESFQKKLADLLKRQDPIHEDSVQDILGKMSENLETQIRIYDGILSQADVIVTNNNNIDNSTASIELLEEYYRFQISTKSDSTYRITSEKQQSMFATMSQLQQVFSQQRFDAAVTELQQGNNSKKGTDAHTLYLTLCETMKSSYSVRDDPVAAIAQHTVDTPGKKPVAKAELRELVIQPLPAIPDNLKELTVNPISQPRAQKESTSTLTARIEMLFKHIKESTHPNVLLNDLLHNGKPPSDKE